MSLVDIFVVALAWLVADLPPAATLVPLAAYRVPVRPFPLLTANFFQRIACGGYTRVLSNRLLDNGSPNSVR